VQQGGTHVEIPLPVRKHPRHRKVEEQPDKSDGSNGLSPDLHGVQQPRHRLDPERCDEHEDEHGIREGRDELGAPKPVGVAWRRRSASEPGRERGNEQRHGVGDHMPGIAKQGE
jgi:hypothetical protein